METVATETILEIIDDLINLVRFLEGQLLDYSLSGNYDGADDVYGELVETRNRLAKLEEVIES